MRPDGLGRDQLGALPEDVRAAHQVEGAPAGAADLLAWGMTRLQEPAEAKPAREKGQQAREVPQQEEGEAQAGPAASAVRGMDGVEDGIPVVEPVMQGDCDEALLEVVLLDADLPDHTVHTHDNRNTTVTRVPIDESTLPPTGRV